MRAAGCGERREERAREAGGSRIEDGGRGSGKLNPRHGPPYPNWLPVPPLYQNPAGARGIVDTPIQPCHA